MNKLILAQGAEHTNPARLQKIVRTIQNEQGMSKYSITDQTRDYLIGKFGVDPAIDLRKFTYVTEEKFDGYSYINQGGEFYSKRLSSAKGHEGEPVCKSDCIHISGILRSIYKACGANLHGELYVPGGISDDVTKILGCTPELAIKRTMDTDPGKRLHYMLIDIREYRGYNLVNEPYWVRRAILQDMYMNYVVKGNLDPDHYIVLPPILSGDPCEHFSRIVNAGGEGVIFKRTSALYVPGKKPADNWVKGKKKITYDVVIMGFNEGTGKNKDMFGSIKFGHYIDGKLTPCGNCSSGLDDETRARIAKDPDSFIGQVMEIEAIQESVKSFRNAVFLRLRDDKGPEECVPINIRVKTRLI